MIRFLLIFIAIILWSVNTCWIPGNDELFICLSLTMFFLVLFNSSSHSIKLLLYSDLKSLHIGFKKTLKFNELLLDWINKMQMTLWSNRRIYLTEFYFEVEALKFNTISQDVLKVFYVSIFNWISINLSIGQFLSSKKQIKICLVSLISDILVRLSKARAIIVNINIIKWLI